jgi:hypothetical protein
VSLAPLSEGLPVSPAPPESPVEPSLSSASSPPPSSPAESVVASAPPLLPLLLPLLVLLPLPLLLPPIVTSQYVAREALHVVQPSGSDADVHEQLVLPKVYATVPLPLSQAW